MNNADRIVHDPSGQKDEEGVGVKAQSDGSADGKGDQSASTGIPARRHQHFPLPGKVRLVDLARQYETVLEKIDDSDTEISAILEQEFGLAKEQLAEKVDACVSFLKFAEGHFKYCEEEVKHWQKRKDSARRAVERFKAYLLYCCEQTGAKLQGEKHVIWSQKNGSAKREWKVDFKSRSFDKVVPVELINFGEIPEEFTEVIEVRVIRTAAVDHALQAGRKLSFVEEIHGKGVRYK